MKKNIFIFIIVLLSIPSAILAHPGRTDSSGCHTCRTNCSSWGLSSGEYHCHRAKSTAPQPKEPIRSHKVEGGTGYTTPAPDYKTPNTDTKPSIDKAINQVASQKSAEEVDKDSNGSSWLLLWIFIAGGVGYAIAKMRKK